MRAARILVYEREARSGRAQKKLEPRQPIPRNECSYEAMSEPVGLCHFGDENIRNQVRKAAGEPNIAEIRQRASGVRSIQRPDVVGKTYRVPAWHGKLGGAMGLQQEVRAPLLDGLPPGRVPFIDHGKIRAQ